MSRNEAPKGGVKGSQASNKQSNPEQQKLLNKASQMKLGEGCMVG
jgi:hypothetical protein